jgi:4'-phosphopantetheinyl transferase EntD
MSHVHPAVPVVPGEPLSAERRAVGVVDVRACDLGWADPRVPAAVLIAYDVEAFDVSAFGRFGVGMPESIGRSVSKRQAEFFMGRLAAGDAVGALVGRAHARPSPLKRLPHEQQIGVGASRQPVWPVGVVGSITHAGRFAAAVAAEGAGAGATGLGDGPGDGTGITGIGIDIERRIGTETCQSVEDTVLKPVEKALLHSLAGEVAYDMLLTIAFSAKESFFKGSFATVGTYFDFDAVEIVALDATGGTLEIMLTRSLAPALARGRRFAVRIQCIDADTVLTSFVW